jgi:hypothetical protein
MKTTYLLLCALGVLLPYAAFGPWLIEHGPAVYLLAVQVVDSPVAAFAWADVLVSAAALLVFMAREHSMRPVRHAWLPLVGLLCVGVSLALPLYLYLRESSGRAA